MSYKRAIVAAIATETMANLAAIEAIDELCISY